MTSNNILNYSTKTTVTLLRKYPFAIRKCSCSGKLLTKLLLLILANFTYSHLKERNRSYNFLLQLLSVFKLFIYFFLSSNLKSFIMLFQLGLLTKSTSFLQILYYFSLISFLLFALTNHCVKTLKETLTQSVNFIPHFYLEFYVFIFKHATYTVKLFTCSKTPICPLYINVLAIV